MCFFLANVKDSFEGVHGLYSFHQANIRLYCIRIEYLYVFMFIIQNTQLWTPDIQPLSKKNTFLSSFEDCNVLFSELLLFRLVYF